MLSDAKNVLLAVCFGLLQAGPHRRHHRRDWLRDDSRLTVV